MIRAEYDREADALYVTLSESAVARTVEVDDHRAVDLDADGKAVGLEVLYPIENMRITKLADNFGFAESLADIDVAVRDALGELPATRVDVWIRIVVPQTYPTTAPSLTMPSRSGTSTRPLEFA